MLIDPRKTIGKAKAAEAAADRLSGRQRILGIATAQWLQGEAYLRLNDLAHAGPLIDRALKAISDDPRPTKLTGDLLLSRGGYHAATANVAAALADYQRAHNIFRDVGETRSRAIALLSIADSVPGSEGLSERAEILSLRHSMCIAAIRSCSLSIYNNRGDRSEGARPVRRGRTALPRGAHARAHDEQSGARSAGSCATSRVANLLPATSLPPIDTIAEGFAGALVGRPATAPMLAQLPRSRLRRRCSAATSAEARRR